MMKKETLGDYIRRVMNESDITFRELTIRSKNEISGAYVNDIIKGKTSNPSVDKLKALAKGLNRPEEELFEIARGTTKPSEDAEFKQSLYYMLYEKSKTASPQKRELIKSVLRMIDRELDDDQKATG
jgi:transcriptional regulator with XRE-family HTH domain